MVAKGWPAKYKSGAIPPKTLFFGHRSYTREDDAWSSKWFAYLHAKHLREEGLRARVAEGVKDGKPMYWVYIGV